MDKIATRAFANTIVPNAYIADLNRCIVYSSVSAESLIKIVPAYPGKYTNATNRLVLTSEIAAPSTPPITGQVQFKVRLLFDIVNLVVYSCKIDLNNWSIRNSSGTILALGSFTTGEILPNTLPILTIGNRSYRYIDFYTSTVVDNIPSNEFYYISFDPPIFLERANNLELFKQAYVTVVNDSASTSLYGYKLSDSSTDSSTNTIIKRLKLLCSGEITIL